MAALTFKYSLVANIDELGKSDNYRANLKAAQGAASTTVKPHGTWLPIAAILFDAACASASDVHHALGRHSVGGFQNGSRIGAAPLRVAAGAP